MTKAGIPHRTAFASILVPTDFSQGARMAVERVAHLPLAEGGQIHLVHVLPSGAARAKLGPQAHRRLAQAASLIRRTAVTAARKPPSVVSKILHGAPFVEIIRHAREVDAELIVLGRKGAGQSIGKALGTTAARVLRMGDTPVLVVRAPPKGAYRRPLIALPLDPSARRLVELTARASECGKDALPVVRAYHVAFSGLIPPGTDAAPSLHHRQCLEKAEKALDAQARSLQRHGWRVNPILRRGEARSVIFSEAGSLRADLLALGTHARSGIAHVLLGSVAEWAAINAVSDVLIARPVRFTFEAP
jgi:nucleotide-binding universal stress UspA family protein